MNDPKNRKQQPRRKPAGSWEGVNRWYDGIVGEKGHYYHRNVILPNVCRLLAENGGRPKLLDVACGQGVLARSVEGKADYVGVDIAPSLIASAKKLAKKDEQFIVGDATKPLPLENNSFDVAVCILAIQDMGDAAAMISHVSGYLKEGGRFIIVMNHPCFRIPRTTSWIDEQGLRSRKINGYMQLQAIPIKTEPSKGERSSQVISYHRPLSTYFSWLQKSGFAVSALEEWVSDKKSTGTKAKMENRAREEFPLFACISAVKIK